MFSRERGIGWGGKLWAKKKKIHCLRKLPGEGGTSDGRIWRAVSSSSASLPATEYLDVHLPLSRAQQ